MSATSLSLLLVLFGGIAAWLLGNRRARQLAKGYDKRAAALPGQYATFLTLCTVAPATVFALVWPFISKTLVLQSVLSFPAAKNLPVSTLDRDAIISEAAGLADGSVDVAFNPLAYELSKPIAEATQHYAGIGIALVVALLVCGFGLGFLKVRPQFRARQKVEGVVMLCLMAASLVALITTFGIVASLLFETGRFFSIIPVHEFLFGTHWAPTTEVVPGEDNGFGAIPLFWGTLFIGAVIAMIFAVPLGLMSAIYMTQYASLKARQWLKPTLEILAGIPTVVYGYFAALNLGPVVRDVALMIGMENPTSESALAAGLVMGVMIIPLISSMADDSIAAVPSAMRDGALALGSTRSETIRKVLIPAALPGIIGGILLAVSRAIGETMIVVMAAGMAANMSANPFASVTTVTTQIVQLLTGDQEFDSAKTLSAFALGLVLFLMTLVLNIIAIKIVKRYREAYE